VLKWYKFLNINERRFINEGISNKHHSVISVLLGVACTKKKFNRNSLKVGIIRCRLLTLEHPTHIYQNLDPLELIPIKLLSKQDLQKLTVLIGSGDRVEY